MDSRWTETRDSLSFGQLVLDSTTPRPLRRGRPYPQGLGTIHNAEVTRDRRLVDVLADRSTIAHIGVAGLIRLGRQAEVGDDRRGLRSSRKVVRDGGPRGEGEDQPTVPLAPAASKTWSQN